MRRRVSERRCSSPSGNSDAASQGLVLKNRWKMAAEMGGGVKLYLDPPWSLRFRGFGTG